MKNALLISILLGFVLLFAGCTSPKGSLSGAAGVVQCTDSDGGNTPGIKGTTKDALGGKTDVCGLNGLTEYYCQNNKVTSITGRCDAGKVCSNGACVAPVAPVVTCADTDRGSTEVKGVVTVTTDGRAGAPSTDSCVDRATVTEYSCNGNAASSANVACIGGRVCNDGACVMPAAPVQTCTDTDGGQVTGTIGTVMVTLGEQVMAQASDSCQDASTVVEQYCNAQNARASANLACGAGMMCQNGACVVPVFACTDSDNGPNVAVAGTTTTSVNGIVNGTYVDTCSTGRSIIEGSCEGTRAAINYMACAEGQTCQNGACVAPPQICRDSDNGLNLQVAGTASTSVAGVVNETFNDLCTANGTGVVEQYCQGNNAASMSIGCPGGNIVCQSGACVAQ